VLLISMPIYAVAEALHISRCRW